MKRANPKFKGYEWQALLIGISLLILWEIASQTGWIQRLLFPPPSKILRTFWKLLLNGVLLDNSFATLKRAVSGTLIGSFLGIGAGIWMGVSPSVRRILDPLIAAIHPIPKTALFPLIMVIFGIGEQSKIILLSLSVFFPVVINTLLGVSQIEQVYYDIAKLYRISLPYLFRKVLLPASLPSILSGIRLAMNTAFTISIVVELINARNGLGLVIWRAWETLRVDEMYATLIAIAIIGGTLNKALHMLTTLLTPWQASKTETS
jgi:NitT/TauT family transport system permease protein